MKNKIAFMLITGLLLVVIAACGSKAASTPEVARPSNPGGVGKAVDLTGDPVSGKQIFTDNCVRCHGQDGKGGVPNPDSADGTVPALNPIDDTIKNADYKTFASNMDLFLEHGSTPAAANSGATPALTMPNWGDSSLLAPQQIADVISYLISLNK